MVYVLQSPRWLMAINGYNKAKLATADLLEVPVGFWDVFVVMGTA